MTPALIRSTFALPIVIAAISVFGLVAALTGDGARDVVAGIALAIPVVMVAWAMRRTKSPPGR